MSKLKAFKRIAAAIARKVASIGAYTLRVGADALERWRRGSRSSEIWNSVSGDTLDRLVREFAEDKTFTRRIVRDSTAEPGRAGPYGLWLPAGSRLETDDEFSQRVEETIEVFESQDEDNFATVRERVAESYNLENPDIMVKAKREGVERCPKCGIRHLGECPEAE